MKLEVTHERWQEAQAWEASVWSRRHRRRGWRRLARPAVMALRWMSGRSQTFADDWNYWWRTQFDDYVFLPHSVGDYLELGCGPYTNTRLILEGRESRRVVCSDPLIRAYLDLPGTWVGRAHRDGAIVVDDHPLEECPFEPQSFDVVVLINVLDHVRDASRCLAAAAELVRGGGYFLLGQDLTDEQDAAQLPGDVDVGHPIRLGLDDLEPYLDRFEPVVKKVLERSAGRNPEAHCGTLIFAGRKSADVL